jgi:hypothetical protein
VHHFFFIGVFIGVCASRGSLSLQGYRRAGIFVYSPFFHPSFSAPSSLSAVNSCKIECSQFNSLGDVTKSLKYAIVKSMGAARKQQVPIIEERSRPQ